MSTTDEAATAGADYEDDVPKVSDAQTQKIHALARDMQAKDRAVKTAEAGVETAKKELAAVRDGTLPAALQEAKVRGMDIEGLGKVAWKNDVYGSLPSADKKPEERAAALAWFEVNDPGMIKRKLEAMLPRSEEGGDRKVDKATIEHVVSLLKRVGPLSAKPAVLVGSKKYPAGYRTALDKSEDSNIPRPGEDTSKWECPPLQVEEPPISMALALEKIIQVLVPGAATELKLDVHPQSLMSWARELIGKGQPPPFRMLGLTPVSRATITRPSAPRGRAASNETETF